jgi:hypothetical protein
MFTPQMIAGSTRKEGMYHFFEMKGTALSLMVPNVGSNGNRKRMQCTPSKYQQQAD